MLRVIEGNLDCAQITDSADIKGKCTRSWETEHRAKWTHYVEIPGQEAIEVSQECREASKAVRTAGAMVMESKQMGDSAKWMVQ